MPLWARDVVPRGSDPAQLRGYLERTLQSLDDWALEINDQILVLQRLRALDGISVRYLWDDDTDTGIPATAGTLSLIHI